MSMFNECHIHLCDCTWLNVFSHAQSLLIKYKNIFECFSCFWKVFCFCKNVKNSVTLFWRLSCGLVQSHALVVSPHRDLSWLTSGSMSQSRKILRIFFKNLVFMFLTAQYSDLFAGGRFSREGYIEIFTAHIATLSRVDFPVVKNTQKIFQIFVFDCFCDWLWRLAVRDRALGPFFWMFGPNPREWVESCYCLSKWRFDWLYFPP